MKLPSIKASAAIKMSIGILSGAIVVVGGFLLVQNVFTKASDTAPRDLIISGITSNTAKIQWTTDQEIQGVIEYGSSPTSLNLFAPETQKAKNHTVDITLLSPATSYYFQIRIGETKYDNGGVPWTFSTKVTSAGSTEATPSAALVPSSTPTFRPGGTATPTSASAFGPLKGSSLKVNPTAIPVVVPSATPTPGLTSFYCVETDCTQICLKMRTGQCSSLEWNKSACTGKVSIGSCFGITPTPTWNPLTPTPTITPTPTTGASPTNTPGPTVPSYMQ